MGSDKRLDERFPARIPVSVRWGRSMRALSTEDVGERGVFLRCNEAPPLRELVRLVLTVDPDGPQVILHGLVAHVVKPDEGTWRTPGFGVQFYGVDPAAQRLWSSFMRSVMTEAARATVEAPPDSASALA